MLCSLGVPASSLPERIAAVLTPDLGANTADAVARHLCAKHGASEGPVGGETLRRLHGTIRQGLVAFVGPEKAATLADRCFPEVASAPRG